MRRQWFSRLAVLTGLLALWGCGDDGAPPPATPAPAVEAPEPSPAAETPKPPPTPEEFLPQAGKTVEATLRAYYYHKDRGDYVSLRALVASNSLDLHPRENSEGMSERAQKARGLIIDHVESGENEATVYYRSWFSQMTEARGGRPYIARLVRGDGLWKHDTKASVQLTLTNTKGKTRHGFYDGKAKWWE